VDLLVYLSRVECHEGPNRYPAAKSCAPERRPYGTSSPDDKSVLLICENGQREKM
jgi:hypothetical protein